MKIISFLLLSLCAWGASAQIIPATPRLAGDYIGICYPVGGCSNERLLILVAVGADATLTGDVINWDNDFLHSFSTGFPFFRSSRFTTNPAPIGHRVTGTFSAAGTLSGTIRLEGGCRYTFKAARRHKVAQ